MESITISGVGRCGQTQPGYADCDALRFRQTKTPTRARR
jgi:hypothetical protein